MGPEDSMGLEAKVDAFFQLGSVPRANRQLNRSQTATVLGVQGQEKTQPQDLLLGAGVSETGGFSKEKRGRRRADLTAQALDTSSPAWHFSITGSLPFSKATSPRGQLKCQRPTH